MIQYSFIEETIRLAPSNATKSQRKKLARYLKKHMFIRRATDPKNGNKIVKDIANDFIDNGYKDPPLISQEELDKALKVLGL